MGNVAIQGLHQAGPVIRVDLDIVTGAGHRDVRQPSVDQDVWSAVGVDVNQDAIGGLALAAVARHRRALDCHLSLARHIWHSWAAWFFAVPAAAYALRKHVRSTQTWRNRGRPKGIWRI